MTVKGKAMIAMSGGVDSSVAAYLMKKAGYECEGTTMRLYRNNDLGLSGFHSCCSQTDIDDAAEIAFELDIPYHVSDYTVDFRERVIDKFIATYENGGTPNPCIDCNRYMKFDKLLAAAQKRGCDYIVTGHYARIEKDADSGRFLLKKAVDSTKDQSYVLYMLTQTDLAHIIFPLGEMKKSEVRSIAEECGFVNARKHDSQDICFVPGGDYASFIEQYAERQYPCGNFVDNDGNVLGEHKGIIRYTIGQRRGLGIASDAPLYVTKINPCDNTVTLSHGEGLFTKKILAGDINLIAVSSITEPMRANVKIRYNQDEQPAWVKQTGDKLAIEFDRPQRAATKGQAVVIYDGDIVVGGGTIIDIL